jgi:hypothetical protein
VKGYSITWFGIVGTRPAEFVGRVFGLSFIALLIYFPPRMFYLAEDRQPLSHVVNDATSEFTGNHKDSNRHDGVAFGLLALKHSAPSRHTKRRIDHTYLEKHWRHSLTLSTQR